jgi:RNA processing factor Prp31
MDQEATTTLADALLDDLDDLSDHNHNNDDDDDDDNNNYYYANNHNSNSGHETFLVENQTSINVTTTKDIDTKIDHHHHGSFGTKTGSNLLEDTTFINHIEILQQQAPQQSSQPQPLTIRDDNNYDGKMDVTEGDDANDEKKMIPLSTQSSLIENKNQNNHDPYKLLVQTNHYLIQLDHELERYHLQLIQVYQHKFPQLDTIITNVQQYSAIVRIVLNQVDMTSKQINDQLNRYLSNQQIMTISIAYSTSNGRMLTTSEVDVLQELLQNIEQLVQYQTVCLHYIEQQMIQLVPNMVAFLNSSSLVAHLLTYAQGSLDNLVKIPACNLQLLGQQNNRTSTSSSSTSLLLPTKVQQSQQSIPHSGILAQCDLVQSVPKSYQQKVLKMVASKLALVIRCDYSSTSSTRRRQQQQSSSNDPHNKFQQSSIETTTTTTINDEGVRFRQEIQSKIQQLLEPDKAPTLKALPKYVYYIYRYIGRVV